MDLEQKDKKRKKKNKGFDLDFKFLVKYFSGHLKILGHASVVCSPFKKHFSNLI
jgi:hypothetical protein